MAAHANENSMIRKGATMPWEITLINGPTPDDSTLGPRAEVTSKIADALPGTQFATGPAMPEEFLAQMPESMREALSRPKLQGLFEHEEYSVQFYGSAEESIRYLHAEVRGDGDPLVVLKTLSDETGWSIWDDAEQKPVDLTNTETNGWKAFCDWRDKAIAEHRTDS